MNEKTLNYAAQRCAKVMRIPLESLSDILRGRRSILNLPDDAQIYAAQVIPADRSLAIRISSRVYPLVPHGEQLPVVTAVLTPNQSRKSA